MIGITLLKYRGEAFETKAKITVEWTIKDFFSITKEADHRLESPGFLFLDALWCLQFSPNGQTKSDSVGWIGMYLKKIHSVSPEHTIKYRMGIRIHDYTYKSVEFEHKFVGNEETWGTPDMAKQYLFWIYYNMYSHDSCITLFCDLEGATKENVTAISPTLQLKGIDASTETLEEDFRRAGVNNKEATSLNSSGIDACTETLEEDFRRAGVDNEEATSFNSSGVDASTETLNEDLRTEEVDREEATSFNSSGSKKLLQDLKNLLEQQQDCDTTIKIGPKEFRAHRLILGARSKVFASMYRHDTNERRSGIVEIEDCDPDVFQIFLLFLYSGKLENVSPENALGLYVVADKYDVQEVKSECVKLMSNRLSVDNFCDVIAVALKYNESQLLKSATDFFVKNARKIVVTVKWLCFHKECPVESNELHIKALEFQTQN